METVIYLSASIANASLYRQVRQALPSTLTPTTRWLGRELSVELRSN